MDFRQPSNENDPNVLEKYTRDITLLAQNAKLDPVIGREEEITRIIRILSRKNKNNPVLIGEPGVGKSAIIEGLAQRIIRNDVPSSLKGRKLLELNVGDLIAGASFVGDSEARVKSLIKAIKESKSEIILFIDELHLIVGAGSSTNSNMDVANLLKPQLARGDIKIIGATTLNEYRQYIEKDSALERRFQRILVSEPNVEETISILRGIKERYENFHKVKITDSALVAAASLSNRYITDRFLPDKAIDLIDEASATIKSQLSTVPTELDRYNRKIMQLEIEKAALSKETDEKSIQRLAEIEKELNKNKVKRDELDKDWNKEKQTHVQISQIRSSIEGLKNELEVCQTNGNYTRAGEIQYSLLPSLEKQLKKLESENNNRLLSEEVNEKEISKIVSRWTGIPIDDLLKAEKDRLLNLESELKKYIKGQNEAIKAVSDSILISRSKIKDPNKPIGTLLFLGPTGVGKTELSKVLAKILFNSEKKLFIFDMSEYMEKHSVSKLIGSPPGYVGYEEGGRLTEAIRRNPYSIVLFDEIEKAHRDVLNVLLQVLDDGRITDSLGKTIDFKNTIIIMTSNIAAEYIMNNNVLNDEIIQKNLLAHLSPEFINRIDNIVVFNKLNTLVIEQIVENTLNTLIERILQETDIEITYTKSVVDKIVKNAYDEQFGARPIKRYIEKNIQTIIAKAIISNEIEAGRIYNLDYKDNNFVISNIKN